MDGLVDGMKSSCECQNERSPLYYELQYQYHLFGEFPIENAEMMWNCPGK